MRAVDSASAEVESILYFMGQLTHDAAGKKGRALLNDLTYRCGRLAPEDRWAPLAKGLYLASKYALANHIPAHILNQLKVGSAIAARKHTSGPSPNRRRADVAIVTVKDVELRAVQIALGIPTDDPEKHLGNWPEPYWQTSLRTSAGKTLRIVLTTFSEQRNVPAAIFTERLLARFDADLCVMVGIAAGLKKLTSTGDVVVAESIIDYEGARLQLQSVKRNAGVPLRPAKLEALLRPLEIRPPIPVARNTSRFCERAPDFKNDFLSRLQALKLAPQDEEHARLWEVKLHRGVVLAGEKLIADGSLKDWRLRLHERIRGAAMEDSGFSQACRFQDPEMPWVVFRGISDAGDTAKRKLEPLQFAAALSAATAAVSFLRHGYQAPNKAKGKT